MAKKKRATQAIKESDGKAVAALLKIFTYIQCRLEPREIRKFAKSMLELWFLEENLPKFVRGLDEFLDKYYEVGVPFEEIGYFLASELRKEK
jgi:hypothetical protein